MMTLVTIFTALVLPIMAADQMDLHVPLGHYIHGRDVAETPTLVLSADSFPTTTIGLLGVPLVLSQTPSPTATATGKVGNAISQEGTFSTSISLTPSTATSTHSTSSSTFGVVGSPLSTSSAS